MHFGSLSVRSIILTEIRSQQRFFAIPNWARPNVAIYPSLAAVGLVRLRSGFILLIAAALVESVERPRSRGKGNCAANDRLSIRFNTIWRGSVTGVLLGFRDSSFYLAGRDVVNRVRFR